MPNNAESNAKKIVRLGLILFTITAITGMILGVVYEITAGPIQKTQERLKIEALAGALPGADEFKPMELASGASPSVTDVQQAFKEGQPAGHCLTVVTKGYAGPIEIVVGIEPDGKLRAIRVLNQTETPGLGAKAALPAFTGMYENKAVTELHVVKTPPTADDQIQAISGATITTDAVTLGVNEALKYWQTNLRGGN